MKNIILVVLIIAAIISCGRNKSWIDVDLGNNYRLITSASLDDHAIVVGDHKTESYLGVVDTHVLNYGFDSKFIIAEQRPRSIVHKQEGMTIREFDKAFNESKFKQYWIVDKIAKKTYGPLKLNEYLIKRHELNVPKSLVFKNY